MSINHTGMKEVYAGRDFSKAPPTYKDEKFIGDILRASRVGIISGGAVIADLMSGPGILGLAIQKRLVGKGNQYYFLDYGPQLDNIPNSLERVKIREDIRGFFLSDRFDAAFVRYGIKDLRVDDQAEAMKRIYESIKPGGRLVLADMVAPNDRLAAWTNLQHSMKQELGGRARAYEGQCHIRTNTGWYELLASAGFYPAVEGDYVSRVNTFAWLRSNQIKNEEQLETINRFLLCAPDEARVAFNIREDSEGVKIDFPVTIISGWKASGS